MNVNDDNDDNHFKELEGGNSSELLPLRLMEAFPLVTPSSDEHLLSPFHESKHTYWFSLMGNHHPDPILATSSLPPRTPPAVDKGKTNTGNVSTRLRAMEEGFSGARVVGAELWCVQQVADTVKVTWNKW